MPAVRLKPPKAIQGAVRLPGSKSFTNRALIAASLADGQSELVNASLSEDTRLLAGALLRDGRGIRIDEADRTIHVQPSGRAPSDRNTFYLGNAGTAVRFFTAYLTLGRGKFVVDGDPAMRRRPIQDLVLALNRLGADVKSVFDNGCPPVSIDARGLAGGRTSVRGDVSSQFASAVFLAAPRSERGVELEFETPLASAGYLDMTLGVMEAFGAKARRADRVVIVVPSGYRPARFDSEPDAAAANYLFAMAAVAGGTVRVEGLGHSSRQPEYAFVEILRRMGSEVESTDQYTQVTGRNLAGLEVDMNHAPDSVQTLAATALFARGPTTIKNVPNLRVKETDRIRALASELSKLGAGVQERPDGLRIEPPRAIRPARIASYQDHRMIMSFAVAAVREPAIVLEDPVCVAKSFPEFWDVLARIGIESRVEP